MGFFKKSKYRNGQRISNDDKWTAVDIRSCGGGRSRRRSSGGGIFSKAIGSAVRKSVRQSLKAPKAIGTPRVRNVKPKTYEDAHSRTTLTIAEMPPELRYLSYPKLRPKAKPQVVAKPVEVAKPKAYGVVQTGSIWELFKIVGIFIADLFRRK